MTDDTRSDTDLDVQYMGSEYLECRSSHRDCQGFLRFFSDQRQKVTYVGESSSPFPLICDAPSSICPPNLEVKCASADSMEMKFLRKRGAFLLPPQWLCHELVQAFFSWVAPILPVVNRSQFMRKFQGFDDPPSHLLVQAILLAGSRVCKNPLLLDSAGSTKSVGNKFYMRAKALYDAQYEVDQITNVQALVLMGWYWEGPEGKRPHFR